MIALSALVALMIALSALVLVACPAAAQEESSGGATELEARRLFERGTEALRADDLEEALAALSESHALLPIVPNTFNLAVALLRAARVRESIALLEGLLEARFGALEPAQRASIQSRLDEARAALAHLRISVAGPDRVSVWVDGVELASLSEAQLREPLSLEVDPGAHHVAVRAPGFVSEAREVELAAGAEVGVAFALRAESSSSSSSSSAAEAGESQDSTWIWVVVSLVVLAAGAGLATTLALTLPTQADPVVDPVTGLGETLTLNTPAMAW